MPRGGLSTLGEFAAAPHGRAAGRQGAACAPVACSTSRVATRVHRDRSARRRKMSHAAQEAPIHRLDLDRAASGGPQLTSRCCSSRWSKAGVGCETQPRPDRTRARTEAVGSSARLSRSAVARKPVAGRGGRFKIERRRGWSGARVAALGGAPRAPPPWPTADTAVAGGPVAPLARRGSAAPRGQRFAPRVPPTPAPKVASVAPPPSERWTVRATSDQVRPEDHRVDVASQQRMAGRPRHGLDDLLIKRESHPDNQRQIGAGHALEWSVGSPPRPPRWCAPGSPHRRPGGRRPDGPLQLPATRELGRPARRDADRGFSRPERGYDQRRARPTGRVCAR